VRIIYDATKSNKLSEPKQLKKLNKLQ